MAEPMSDERVTEILHAATLGKGIDLGTLVRDSTFSPERKEELREAIGTVWMKGVRELAAEVRRFHAVRDALLKLAEEASTDYGAHIQEGGHPIDGGPVIDVDDVLAVLTVHGGMRVT